MEHRRSFVVGILVALVLLAGCSAAGSLGMSSTTDNRVAEQARRPLPERSDETGNTGGIVRAAIENGSATAHSREPLVEAGLPFRYEGRYYNLTSSVVDRQPGTFHSLGIDYNGTAQENATVDYENLSARDRMIIDRALPSEPITTRPGSDFYIDATYTAAEHNQSVLLADDTEAVRYEGDTSPVVITETESVTVPTRRYTATLVANNTEAYVQQLQSEYVFSLSGLSDAERSVVNEAINGTYYAENDDDEPFQSVLERFHRHEAVQQNEYRGTWLVRYEGEVYLAELSYDGFDVG